MLSDPYQQAEQASYGENVAKDCYLLRRWGSDFFDYIIDIGANVGVFANYAHMRHPEAKVFCYEPHKETFDRLSEKMFMDNVICKNEALGDGSYLVCHNTEYPDCNLFFKKGESELEQSYSIPSRSLSDIFKQNSISLESDYYIKIDCEGGERFLLDDKESISVIKKSCGTGIEVHFPPVGGHKNEKNEKRFRTFPTWDTYNAWMHDEFSVTHEIIYHCSRGGRGSGVFVLLERDRG